MREEFEKWYMEVWGKTEDCKSDYVFDKSWNGEYMRLGVRLAWSAFSVAWEMGNNDYRARATRAEQEAAGLREQLAKRPDYEWFVELVRKHLKQEGDVCPQRLAHQVKQLKEASTKRRQNRECAEDE